MEVEFHKAQSSISVNISTGATMDKVRTQLSQSDDFMLEEDRFLIYNSFRKISQSLEKDEEDEYAIEDVISNNNRGNKITLSAATEDNRDFSGVKRHWFVNNKSIQPTLVQVVLNQFTTELVDANEGKLQPIMLSNIKATDPEKNKTYSRAVICEKGSIVQINVQCWSPAGFRLTIGTGQDDSNIRGPSNYLIDDPEKPGIWLQADVKEYNTGKSIVIDDFAKLKEKTGRHLDDVFEYAEVRIKTWRIDKWSRGGKTYSGEGLAVPSFRGSIDVHAELVEVAGPYEGELDGGEVSNSEPWKLELEKKEPLLGDISFVLMVFKNQEAIDRVVHVINRGI